MARRFHLSRDLGRPLRLEAGPTGEATGFTLVELLVVVVVFGVVAAVIVPEFRGTREEARLRASARSLVTMLNLAWSQAVSTHSTQRVRIDTRDGRFWLETYRESSSGGTFVPATERLPRSDGRLHRGLTAEVRSRGGSSYERRRAAAFEQEAAAPDSIRFFPDGTAEGREIILHDAQGFGVSVRVDPVTSRTRVFQLERLAPP